MEMKEFSKKIFSSFIPAEYDNFVQKPMKEVFVHFVLVLLVFVLLVAVLNVPKAAMYPEKFGAEFSKFSQFKVNVNATAKEPVDLWLVSIDTNNNTNLKEEGVRFSKNYLQIKYLSFMPPVKENISEYKDFIKSSDKVRGKLIFLGILLIPSLLFAAYLYYFIKFSLIILIATIVGLVISRIAKHDIEFLSIIKVCIFASPFLMLELLLRVFNLGILIEQLAPLVLFALWTAIAVYRVGGGMGVVKKRKKGVFESAGKHKVFEDDDS